MLRAQSIVHVTDEHAVLDQDVLLARVAFIGCYLADRASLRSFVWVIAFALNVSLFFVAAFAGVK